MKMTIDLPEELIKAIKIRAAQEQRTVRELVAAYLTDGFYPSDAAPTPAPTATAAATDIEMAPWGLPIIRSIPGSLPCTMTGEETIEFINNALTELDYERYLNAIRR
ncbi:MAG: hypothetical protein DWI54_01135 [Chloroflexi bacterium]|nr:MAG: hypothetical protein DWI54_01135 [Chloroflexota bacterium]RLT33438.1 MAG: hypothetical protein DWI55_02660 [Chloroflexota bacterium]